MDYRYNKELDRFYDTDLSKMRQEYETTVLLEGMNCNQTQALAEQVLKGIRFVKSVKASHKDNMALITSSKLLNEEEVKKALENVGFRVLNIY